MIYNIKRRRIKTIICAGQSNENGSVPGPHNAPYTGYQQGYIFYKPDLTATDNGSFKNFRYGDSNNFGAVTNYVQPFASCIHRFYELTNEPLLIIRHSYNGAAMVDNGSPYVNGIWQWDANPANANGLMHYDILLNRFLIPAVQKAYAARFEVDIIAFCWTQGETDTGDLTRATGYQSKFVAMFEKLKLDLAEFNVLSPTFRPLISRIHNNFTPGTRPYLNEVRTAQTNIAAIYGSPWINTDAYPVAADNTHFTIEAQETHGVDRANFLANQYV